MGRKHRKAEARRRAAIAELAKDQLADDSRWVRSERIPKKRVGGAKRHNKSTVPKHHARPANKTTQTLRGLPPESLAEIERLYVERIQRRNSREG